MGTKQEPPACSFEEAVLKARVAQLCDHVGYHAITQDSYNVLVDIYQRIIIQLAQHCKNAANNNRRTEPTLLDLVQAYDFVGISISGLQEYIETTKLQLNIDFGRDEERKPSNRIQRNLVVDDLLEAEKNNHPEDQDGEGENKAMSENGVDEDEKPSVPLLKDTYEEIARKFGNCTPVKADKKIRGGRILVVANTKLKIKAPIPPEPEPSSSSTKDKLTPLKTTPSPKAKGNRRKKIKEPIKKVKVSRKTKDSSKAGRKPRAAVKPLDPSIAEPPSFFNILDTRPDISILDETAQDVPDIASSVIEEKISRKSVTPAVEESFDDDARMQIDEIDSPILTSKLDDVASKSIASSSKQSKVKKKKRSSGSKFAIVTETVPAPSEEKEWFCPKCNGPDDGDLMVQCDSCQEWFHLRCTKLKKPPEDDEHWDCDKCTSKKSSKPPKKPQVVVEVLKTKTPEPVIATPPPPPTVPVAKPAVAGTSSDDCCPECNLPDDGSLMIQCEDPFCAKWFHGKCVDLLEEPKDDESWFCKVCVEKQQSAFKRRRRAK